MQRAKKNTKWNIWIGYKIRFKHQTIKSANAIIKFKQQTENGKLNFKR